MTKAELIKLLHAYDDNQLVLVEGLGGGFEEPKIYVTAVRQRRGNEFEDPFASEYVAAVVGQAVGGVVVGTAQGLLTTSL